MGLSLGACSSVTEPTDDEQLGAVSQALEAQAWAASQAYSTGDLVTHGGSTWRCLIAHTSQTGWEPGVAPSLWALESTSTEPTGSAGAGGGSGAARVATLTLDHLTLETDCDADPESCCPSASTVAAKTDGDDTVFSVSPSECILGKSGRDTVFLQSAGPSALLLGPGDDTAMDGPGDDLIWGGLGNDTINGHGGTNLFFGGPGDDTIYAANGTNTVIPGPGADTVALGNGDDTLYVFDLCEVAAGERLDGGGGNNTLVTPVSVEALRALGVTVANFGKVKIERNSWRSQCAPKGDCAPSTDACTTTFWDAETERCLRAPKEGATCDDGDPSTSDDICVRGSCTGSHPPRADETCGSDEAYEQALREDPSFGAARRNNELQQAAWEARREADPESGARTGVVRIPVVVHVVWHTQAENISDAQIQAQIDTLNEDYRRLNADAASVPEEFSGVTADLRVEFALARRDPDCQPTSGITRTETTRASAWCASPTSCGRAVADEIKSAATEGADPWPSERYLNVWVGNVGPNLLGRATFPGEPAATDGVVVSFDAFGPTTRPGFDGGRTLTHELGHFFDLAHTFETAFGVGTCQGASAETCASEGDLVCDTPATKRRNFGCPAAQNTCTDKPTDLNDQTMNYMDYVDDACMFMFSAGQGTRVDATLNVARRGLMASDGLIPPPASPTADLWGADDLDDTGVEPNAASANMWNSDDIWVRNNDDGLLTEEHQNPVYRASGEPNHVYVRVRNLGCQAASPAEVKLYWAKASTNLSWPAPWTGTVTSPALMGSPIGAQSTESVAPGAWTVLEFPWSPPNPSSYASFGGDASHFCLLARTETAATSPFGMTVPETTDLVQNVRNNNNIVWKNVTVAGDSGSRVATVTLTGTPDGARARVRFVVPARPARSHSVFDWGTVQTELTPRLYSAWVRGGRQGQGVQDLGANRVRVLKSGATLGNLGIPAGAVRSLVLRFEPSAASASAPGRRVAEVYPLEVEQYAEKAVATVAGTQAPRLIGGQTVVLKTLRPLVEAPVIR